ncbi:FtsX-like permease family protein [Catenuloplanes japonicus]|uniref:FtsX-like permease family protein n=1 Tax=Catenuloplanes japonicus TaxID=33876 RepID=UPI000A84E5D0|nr:FtsX-like permease family protein [Catenuloplanes japonicus]
MTALVRAALRARWQVALVMTLLAAVATVAAVSSPLYRAAAVESATYTEIRAALPEERRITADRHVPPEKPDSADPFLLHPPELAEELPAAPGFDTIGGLWLTGKILAPDTPLPDRSTPEDQVVGMRGSVMYRDGACGQVTVSAGRCATGLFEIMVSARVADRLGLDLTRTVTFYTGKGLRISRYTVVGVYTPDDTGADYWSGRTYFAGFGARDPIADPFITTRETVARTPGTDYLESADLVALPGAFPEQARAAADIMRSYSQGVAQWSTDSRIPALDQRLTRSRAQLTEGLALAGLPLVLLAWFVLYFAITFGAGLRRSEAGLHALRGTPPGVRWALASAEAALPVLAGAPIGYLAAWLIVSVMAATTMPGAPAVTPHADSVLYAAVAVGGALLIGLIAQWRTVSAPVAALLRSTPPRQRPVAIGTGEAVVGALAAAAAYQVGTVDGPSGGLELLVPLLIALTAGLLGARAAGLIAGRLAHRSLRRGRIVRGLAAAEFARHPVQVRVVALTVIVFSLVGFAATASVVASEARTHRAVVDVGAPRVLHVEPVGERDLLRATRAADPEGRYAMATARLTRTELPGLAVDSTRLAAVASWDPGFGLSAAEVAALIRPVPATPLQISGDTVTLRASAVTPAKGARVWLVLLPETGPVVRVMLGELTDGVHDYTARTPACATGCTVGSIEMDTPVTTGYRVDVTLLSITDGSGPVEAGLTAQGRWRTVQGSLLGVPGLTATATGLQLLYNDRTRPDLRLVPVSTAIPLPVVSRGEPKALPSATGMTPVARVATIPVGPGGNSTLVDLEYADLAAYDAALAAEPQVWLTADAPASVIDALTANGLTVLRESTIAGRHQVLAGQGPALAIRFHLLTAAGAVLLGVGALFVLGADRPRRVRQLRALRVQGLRAGPAWRSQLAAQLAVILAGAVLGVGAGALAWWTARGAITYYVDGWDLLAPPAWPGVAAVLGPLAALVLLSLVAAGSAVSLRRTVEER